MKRKIMAWILGLAMLMMALPVAGVATETADPAVIAASASQNIGEEADAPETEGELNAASSETPGGETLAQQPQTPDAAQPADAQAAALEVTEGADAPGGDANVTGEPVAPGEITRTADAANGGLDNQAGAPDGGEASGNIEQTEVGSSEANPPATASTAEPAPQPAPEPAPALTAELIAPKNVALDGVSVTVGLRAASDAAEITARYYLLVNEALVSESEAMALTDGEGSFSFTPEYSGIYTVKVDLSDSEGNAAQAAALIAVSEREPEDATLVWYEAAWQAVADAVNPSMALAAAARSQWGYAQSAKDFFFDENGLLHYFNIYSDYESDWNVPFASWCAAQAGIEALSGKKDIPELADALANANALLLEGYQPAAGDLSFVMMEDGAVHAGVIVAVNEAGFDAVEGDCNGAVELRSYALDDANLKAFGSISALLGAGVQTPDAEQGGDAQPQPEAQITYYCNQKEHVHNHGCYGVSETGEPVLICGLEQHEHSAACLDPQQANAQPAAGDAVEAAPEGGATAPEAQEQPHPAGYLCGKEAHAHGEDCYDANGELVCGKEAHAHDESCLTPPEPEPEVSPEPEPEHAACDYARDADGSLILDEAGNPTPILAEGATEKPVGWLRGADGALILDESGNPIPVRYVPVSAAKIENLVDELDPNRHVDIEIRWADEAAETHSFGDEAVLTAVLTGYDNAEYTLQWQTGETEDSYVDVPGATEAEYRTIVTEDNVADFWRVAVTVTGETEE